MDLIDIRHLRRLVAEAGAGRSKRKELLRQRAEKAKKEVLEKAKAGNHKSTSGPSSPPKTTTSPATTTPAT